MELNRLAEAIGSAEAPPVEILDLAYDTRSVSPGSLFFCIPGAAADGHDLAAEAVRAGAVALVAERRLAEDVPQLLVPSVRGAMGPAATLFFADPSRELEVAAVTGTNGKTTTAFLLHAILDAAGRRPALLTNIKRVVGEADRPTGLNTPEAIDLQRLLREMVDAGNRSLAMEATSIASANGRLAGTRFAVLVFTNLTQDHLDFHGTMEEYYEAKRALFAQADRAVVNVADEWGARLARELGDGTLTVVFGAGGDRDREKRPLMGRAAAAHADRAIVTTDNPRSEDPATIAAQVADGTLEIILDRGAAIRQAIADAAPGDVVVIAGKGADTEMEIAGGNVAFDDRVVAREALA